MSSTIILNGSCSVFRHNACKQLPIGHLLLLLSVLPVLPISGHDALGIAAAYWLRGRSGITDCGQFLLP